MNPDFSDSSQVKMPAEGSNQSDSKNLPTTQDLPTTQPAPSYSLQNFKQQSGLENHFSTSFSKQDDFESDNTFYNFATDVFQQPRLVCDANQNCYYTTEFDYGVDFATQGNQFAPPIEQSTAEEPLIKKQVSEPVLQSKPVVRKNYYHKKIESTTPVELSSIIGKQEMDTVEFDDYHEKHAEKFFTPEINEIFVYYTGEYLVGLQAHYRDSWGQKDREVYKGNLHMSESSANNEYQCSSIKLDFDDYIKQVYAEGQDYISYFKIVSYKGKVIEFGQSANTEPKNLIPEMTKCIGIGGSHGTFISSLYFYCS